MDEDEIALIDDACWKPIEAGWEVKRVRSVQAKRLEQLYNSKREELRSQVFIIKIKLRNSLKIFPYNGLTLVLLHLPSVFPWRQLGAPLIQIFHVWCSIFQENY